MRTTRRHEAWQSFELDSVIVRSADGDEHCHTFGLESTGDEGDHRCRLVVQPLRVVDDRRHRLNSSGLAEQAQTANATMNGSYGACSARPSAASSVSR